MERMNAQNQVYSSFFLSIECLYLQNGFRRHPHYYSTDLCRIQGL